MRSAVLGFAGLKSIWTGERILNREVLVGRERGFSHEKGSVGCGQSGLVGCKGVSGSGVSGEKGGATMDEPGQGSRG